MKYFTFLIILLSFQTFSQSFAERELKTKIDEVTIYIEGGLISRVGKIEIPEGKSIVQVKSLSPHIDDKSIQVKALGDFTILSVNHRLNYLDRIKKDIKIDSLNKEISKLEFQIATSQSRLEVLEEKQSLLDENKNLGGKSSGASLTQIKQAIEFYDRELTSVKKEEIDTKQKIKLMQKEREKINQEISSINGFEELPTGEIEIRIESEAKSKGDFKITYLVANTGWYPKYDVRVAGVEEPLELKYKADIYQNTGVDWGNVKLKLSNGNPNQSGLAPDLRTWYLNYTRNTIVNRSKYGVASNSIRSVSGKIIDESGESLPGATIIVKGTTVGTVSDFNGNFSLTLPNGASYLSVSYIGFITEEIPISSSNITITLEPDVSRLEEVVVVAYGVSGRSQGRTQDIQSKKAETVRTTTIENQTTVELEVEQPYSVKSNGDKLSVDLKSIELETLYEYYAIPKLDKDAFLIAKVLNWDQHNLLEGEANLYFEDAYVGRSILDARSLKDTLEISIGRDKSIVIGREKMEEFSKRKTIGSNKIDSRSFQIIARNKKSEQIKLTLFDQIPVAAISDISVTPIELSNGKLNEKTGEVIWEMELSSQSQNEMTLRYEVKYPKREKVTLE